MWEIQPLSVTNNKEVVIVSIQRLKTAAVQNVTSLFPALWRVLSDYLKSCSHLSVYHVMILKSCALMMKNEHLV